MVMREDIAASPTAARLLETTNWAATPLGKRESWPAALRYAVSLALNSGFPMLIWWGPDAIQIYNDAYIQVMGKRHPAGFGQPGAECWPEAWDIVAPLLERARTAGEPFTAEDMAFTLERNGFVEEAYFTFLFQPDRRRGRRGRRFVRQQRDDEDRLERTRVSRNGRYDRERRVHARSGRSR